LEESEELKNRLEWIFPKTCVVAPDLNAFNIYYSSTTAGKLELVNTIDASTYSFDHVLKEYISGCYRVSAIDSSGNESDLSNELCIENCPSYELPNSFTPNGDNANDVFKPTKNRFISKVVFKVYNIWGQKVFETDDPNINWNGTNKSGKELSEGTYYYVCETFKNTADGSRLPDQVLKGSIYIFR
jgi:gliding motility-associated-like protein